MYRPSVDQSHLYAIMPPAEEGHRTRVACNDVYVRIDTNTSSDVGVSGIELGNHALHDGDADISRNRICDDDFSQSWYTDAIGGYGSCGTKPASVVMTNNVIEAHGRGNVAAVDFYSCRSDLDLVLTNNTILTDGAGVTGYTGDSKAPLRVRLVNNVLYGTGSALSSSGAVSLTGSASVVESSGNLIFGAFESRAVSPSPLAGTGDDTTSQPALASVLTADFAPIAGGLAVGRGKNVYGLSTYGNVTVDLAGKTRSPSAAWSRGARQ